MKKILLRTMVMGLLAAGMGCGYALLGHGTTGIDPSIKRIGVPQFKDHTGRAGLDQRITARVIEELGKRGHFEVVQDATGVDAVVEGELLSYTEAPVAFTQGKQATQASRTEVLLVAKVKYSKIGATEPIWSSDNFSVKDDYNPSDDTAGLADSDQALDRLATAFARQLVAGMFEAF